LMGIFCGILFARTPGMAMLGMGVARLDVPGTTVGIWRGIVRTLLTACLFPAAMVDADGRGIHDRATGTVVVRAEPSVARIQCARALDSKASLLHTLLLKNFLVEVRHKVFCVKRDAL